jgi:DNA polymerase bacteriophage-type
VAQVIFRDIETRSTINLKDVGSFRYAQHPSTEVLCVGYGLGDGPVKIWRPGMPAPSEFKKAGIAVAHNAAFEMLIERCILGPRYGFAVVSVENNRCTMAMANACALPGALEGAAKVLHLENQKDVVGNRLMKAMSKPRKARKGEDPSGTYWWDDPDRLSQLERYCMQDVEVTRELYNAISQLSDEEQRLWVLDQKINAHGFYLDHKLAEAARRVAGDAFSAIDAELAEVTNNDVTTVNQVAKLKEWLRQSCGLDVPDLNKDAIEELLSRETLSAQARRAIELRSLGAQAAVKKVDALLQRREDDGRIRGAFTFHAAGTGRWASRGAQIHNLKRPETDDLSYAIKVIEKGDYEYALKEFDNPLSVIGDLIRSMICAAPGKLLMGADFSGIEARITAWLAGEETKLEVFRRFDAGTGPDPYLVAAGRIYNKPPEQIDPKSFERQVGKGSELALGFQGGIKALLKFLPADTTFDDKELTRIKNKWRQAHPHIERFWHNIDKCARKAVRNPGQIWSSGCITMRCDDTPFLWVTLPSGRRLAYPHARITKALVVEGRTFEHENGMPSLLFKDNSSGQWRDVRAYGGILVENLVQATARDLLAEAMTRLDAAGFKVVTHTHDSVVVEVPKAKNKILSEKRFLKLMTESPSWGKGLPIVAKMWKGNRNQ